LTEGVEPGVAPAFPLLDGEKRVVPAFGNRIGGYFCHERIGVALEDDRDFNGFGHRIKADVLDRARVAKVFLDMRLHDHAKEGVFGGSNSWNFGEDSIEHRKIEGENRKGPRIVIFRFICCRVCVFCQKRKGGRKMGSV